MSRFYEMSVEISGHDPAKAAEIRAAAEEEWPFDDWWGCPWDDTQGTAMHASAQHQLCGGEKRRAVHRAFVRGDLAGQRRFLRGGR